MHYDESNMGLDPELKRYFKKIINSFSLFLLWMLIVSTAGFYFELATVNDHLQWYNIIFYITAFLLLLLFLRFLYKTWKE
jgi:hypothetical protein